MAVRNFFLTANIDGRAGKLTGGPGSKTGGLDMEVKQRGAGGAILPGPTIIGVSDGNEVTMHIDIPAGFVLDGERADGRGSIRYTRTTAR